MRGPCRGVALRDRLGVVLVVEHGCRTHVLPWGSGRRVHIKVGRHVERVPEGRGKRERCKGACEQGVAKCGPRGHISTGRARTQRAGRACEGQSPGRKDSSGSARKENKRIMAD